MLAKSLLFLASTALVAAAPPARKPSTPCKLGSPASSKDIVLPKNGGAKELEFLDGLELKHVALGHGYQNYTCDSAGVSTATGALAVLYDVSPFHPGHEHAVRSLDDWFAIAKMCSYTMDPQLRLDSASTAARVAGAEKQVNIDSPFFSPNKPINIVGVPGELKPIGVHYFDVNKVPTFAVGNDLFASKKLDAVDAPNTAAPGQNGEKPVGWLYLGDAGGSTGIDYVYRVNTVGGSKHDCDVAGDDSTEYSAFYYMYAKKKA